MKGVRRNGHPWAMRGALTERLVTGWLVALVAGSCTFREHVSDVAIDSDGTVGSDDQGEDDRAPASSSRGDSTSSTTGDDAGESMTSSGADLDTAAMPDPDPDPDGSSSGAASDADDDEGGTTDSGVGLFGAGCCFEQDVPGCDDPEVTACVCEHDPYCCNSAWDAVCVDLMQDVGCLACDEQPPAVVGECCAASYAESCLDADVAACVCESDPFCCNVQWDEACAQQVQARGCGVCAPASLDPCCTTSVQPGCSDPQIEACVCDSDPFCCDVQWDNLCVNGVQMYECGECQPPPPGIGDCCVPTNTPGCNDPLIQDCVCLGDPFCCQTAWDQLCVGEVTTWSCGSCEPDDGDPYEPGETG